MSVSGTAYLSGDFGKTVYFGTPSKTEAWINNIYSITFCIEVS